MADKKKILVVDDEPDIVQWLTLLFEENGYDAIHAYDGAEGFEKAVAEHPDLITLDISMDKESGVKMYSKLLKSENAADIPVVMLTAATPQLNEFLKRMKVAKDPEAFLEKPVGDEEVIATVKKIIG